MTHLGLDGAWGIAKYLFYKDPFAFLNTATTCQHVLSMLCKSDLTYGLFAPIYGHFNWASSKLKHRSL